MRANQPSPHGTAPQDFRDGHSAARPHGMPYLSVESKPKVGESFGLTKKETKNLLGYFQNGRYMFTNWKKLNVTKELNAKISQEVYA